MFPAAPSVFVVVCISLSLLCREAAKTGFVSAKPTIKLCFLFVSALAFHYLCSANERMSVRGRCLWLGMCGVSVF